MFELPENLGSARPSLRVSREPVIQIRACEHVDDACDNLSGIDRLDPAHRHIEATSAQPVALQSVAIEHLALNVARAAKCQAPPGPFVSVAD